MKNIIQRLIDDENISNDHDEVVEEFLKYFSSNVNYNK